VKRGCGIGNDVLLSVPVKTPLPYSHSLDRASLRELSGSPEVKLPIVFLLLPRLPLSVDVEYEFDLSDSDAIVERRELHCWGRNESSRIRGRLRFCVEKAELAHEPLVDGGLTMGYCTAIAVCVEIVEVPDVGRDGKELDLERAALEAALKLSTTSDSPEVYLGIDFVGHDGVGDDSRS
jgi:hypothetical protein